MSNGVITNIYKNSNGALQGRVKDSATNQSYKIYFSRGVSGIKKDDKVVFELVESKNNYCYAKYIGLISDCRTENSGLQTAAGTEAPAAESGEKDKQYQTVTQLNGMIKAVYNGQSRFKNVLVKGEVTNYTGKPAKGHYFAIKDGKELINCVFWDLDGQSKLSFELKSGVKVGILGNVDFYPGQGKTQIVVKEMADLGEGEAKLALQMLINKLGEEGLFIRKRPIPSHPQKIGIITSSAGRARGDIATVAREQNPYVALELYGVGVQGKSAPESIKKGIEFMDARGYDVLIVGRGGGSEEDLSCFNSEIVARAIFNTKTPIVSAVGHAADQCLADLVADANYATPSHAVGQLIPNVMKDIKAVDDKQKQLNSNILGIIEKYKGEVSRREKLLIRFNPENKLKDQQNRLVVSEQKLKANIDLVLKKIKDDIRQKEKILLQFNPENKLKVQQSRLALSEQNLKIKMNRIFENRRSDYQIKAAKLDALAPTKKLVNGFGYILANGMPVLSVNNVKVNDEILITIHDGEISTVVKKIEDKK